MKDSTITPVKKNWIEKKDKFQAKFPKLTDADLSYEEGEKDAMLTKIQTKLGKTKEELKSIISAL